MAPKILYKSSVSRDLKHLEPKAAKRILSGIEEAVTQNPNAGEPLDGEFKGLYKLRVGEYRVIYVRTGTDLLILRIRHRSKAYD